MQFGIYLCRNGIITADQLVTAMEMQDEQMVPLGVIAMEEGKLSVRDVFSILRVQSDLPNDRFGDIAIDLGLMTKRDLAELLMLQSNRRAKIGDCLTSLGFLSQEQLDKALAAYRRDRERGGNNVQHVAQGRTDDANQQALDLASTS